MNTLIKHTYILLKTFHINFHDYNEIFLIFSTDL